MKTSNSATLPVHRAPMLWMLVPWCLGYVVAALFVEEHQSPILWVLWGVCYGILLSLLFLGTNDWRWKLTFAICSGITAILWWGQVDPSGDHLRDAWMGFPPRERTLELEVDTIHRIPTSGLEGVWDFEANFIDYVEPTVSNKPLHRMQCSLYLFGDDGPLSPGDRVWVRGVIYPPSNPFDSVFRFRMGEMLQIEHRGQVAILYELRRLIMRRLTYALEQSEPEGKPYAGYIQSMLTGDKRYLTFADKQRFRDAGVMHFFAISGFHLTVVAMVCFSCLQLLGFSKRASSSWMLVVCAGYVWVTGSPVSAQRAFLMMLLYVSSGWVRRKPDVLSATVWAAWCILLIDPPQLFTPGFQLSFAVVIGIITQAIPLNGWLSSRIGKDRFEGKDDVRFFHHFGVQFIRFNLASLAVSWTAFWVSAPIVSCYFGTVPVAAILLNTLLIPLFTLTMVAGFLSAIFGVVGLFPVSGFFNHAIWMLLSGVDGVIGLAERMPLGWEMKANPVMAAISVSLILWMGCFWDLRRRRNRFLFVAFPLISFISVIFSVC